MTTFLPTVTEVHRWSDRRKTVILPLFSCYLFVKLMPSNKERQRVLRIDSVLGLVGNPHGLGTPIPNEQIDAVRIGVKEQLACCSIHRSRLGSACASVAVPWTVSRGFSSLEREIAD